jgi:hypothetical protein
MRLVAVVVAACLAMLFAAGVSATPGSPFVGTWWATDPTDQSLEQLTFGEGGSMFFRDDLATSCGGVPAIATDTGTVSGNVWTGSGEATLSCLAHGHTVPNLFFQFTLQPDGTLRGATGNEVWTRARP